MIPANKFDAVKKALQTSFGVSIYEDIQQLTKGLSGALVCKITVHGSSYLLRIITRTDSRDNPVYYFGCMQSAADSGIAPKIHYLSVEDRVSITDFIEGKTFPVADARLQMADLIRHLHALPKFSSKLPYLDAADTFLQKFKDSGIVPQAETKIIFDLYERVIKIYPRNDEENIVSSHNDIKPDNIIFDGVRPWLVDWEAARLNDRYLDLAAIANFLVKNDADEAIFLERYFEGNVDEYKRARFFIMSNIVHMFCFTLCTISVAGGKPINIKMDTPGFHEFHDRLWNGKIDLGNNEEKLQYALVHMEELTRKMQSRRFDESLRILTAYHSPVELR